MFFIKMAELCYILPFVKVEKYVIEKRLAILWLNVPTNKLMEESIEAFGSRGLIQHWCLSELMLLEAIVV